MKFEENCRKVVARLQEIKIVPVLVLNDVDSGLKMCEILCECGLPAAEITFRTGAAADVISAAAKRFPELYLGAGTVLKPADLDRAFDAGARFAVAPGFNPTVVRYAVEKSYAFAPGVCTPSEIEQAMELGCRFLKFFPAEASGGLAMIKSLIAPYKHLGVSFMPTGGITSENCSGYLQIPQITAVGGTWLGKTSDIESGNWEAIAAAVRAAAALKEQFVNR